jgi:hypothetical protein
VRVGLEHRRPGSDSFSPLAPKVAWSTHLIQAALCRWEIRGGWQGTLASSLSRPIHIEDEPLCSLPIPQPARFFLLFQWSGDQIFEKHRAQCIDGCLIESREKATECRAVREAFAPEERHERSGERLDALIERFQRAFAADGIAQQHHGKIDQVVMAEPASGEAHPLFNRRKNTQVPKILRESAVTPPNHAGTAGVGSAETWIETDECVIRSCELLIESAEAQEVPVSLRCVSSPFIS